MKKITSGVYMLYKNDNIVYVGESSNILSRIGQHIKEGVKDFDEFEYFELEEEDRMNLEAFIIRIVKPKYNISSGCPTYNKDIVKIDFSKFDFHKILEKTANDKLIIDACKNLYKLEQYIYIKQLSNILGLTNHHIIHTLTTLNAPIERCYDSLYIKKDWLYKHFEKFIILLYK